jgi:deazaflavin-dependent oxidoreductase (nitroreductase family)
MDVLIKLFTRLNAFLLRATGGRLGGQLGRQSILLLTTTGRRSSRPRVAPLSYYRDGTRYIVVASNWGKGSHPEWLLNLRRQPRAAIQVNGQDLPVEARLAQGDEYSRLWRLVTERNPQYLVDQKQTARQIPVVILSPAGEAA